jgi:hypothetical protein
VETNAAIGREEKEELWSAIPDIHISALGLLFTMMRRFRGGMTPLVPEVLDHLIRVTKSGIANTTVRMAGYKLLNNVLALTGPTLSKSAVAMLEPIIAACCRDLQEDAGFLKSAPKTSVTPKNDNKKNGLANADLFLQPQASATEISVHLHADHKASADALLAVLLSSLPQHHLKPTLRGLLDKTAILTQNRDAMLSSVLNPYKDQRGRMYPSILPHLSQQFPQDQGLEILRSNLRTSTTPGGVDLLASVTEAELDEEQDDVEEEMGDDEPTEEEPAAESLQDIVKPTATTATNVELPIQSNPFEAKATKPNAFGLSAETRPESPTKRKHENTDAAPSKRQEVDKSVPATLPEPIPAAENDGEGSDSDSDSDVSVHLNMELDDDEEDEAEEE